MPKSALIAEAEPDLADALHAERVQATSEPEWRLEYEPEPRLKVLVDVAPWDPRPRRRRRLVAPPLSRA